MVYPTHLGIGLFIILLRVAIGVNDANTEEDHLHLDWNGVADALFCLRQEIAKEFASDDPNRVRVAKEPFSLNTKRGLIRFKFKFLGLLVLIIPQK